MKIALLGHFGEGKNLLNGQTIKTKNLASALETYTDCQLVRIDTHGWSKRPFRLLQRIKQAFQTCDCVVMLPAHNGVRLFAPVLARYKRKYGKKIYYDVVGGWLPRLLEEKPHLKKALLQFDGLWVETSTMQKALIEKGFARVAVIPNVKALTPLRAEELTENYAEPLSLCVFSRVMREKGIETLTEVLREVNAEKVRFTLDIYGQIESGQEDWFAALQRRFPSYVRYRGCVNSEKSVETLKEYFALVFPTHFYTEGVPGTLIDAYAAGIPVISAKWESFLDVVDEGKTGVGYSFDDRKELKELLLRTADEPQTLFSMKLACLKKAEAFLPKVAAERVMEQVNEGK